MTFLLSVWLSPHREETARTEFDAKFIDGTNSTLKPLPLFDTNSVIPFSNRIHIEISALRVSPFTLERNLREKLLHPLHRKLAYRYQSVCSYRSTLLLVGRVTDWESEISLVDRRYIYFWFLCVEQNVMILL